MEIKSIDKSTFDAVYNANVEKVYRVALYYSNDHHAAEDITQAVFMTLCTNMDNINMDRVEAWAKSTAKHMALNYNRHARFEVDLEIENVEELIDSVAYEDSVEMILAHCHRKKMCVELIERIYTALYQENPRWYEAITITYILEKPQKEVAEAMGMSIGSLRVMLYRAKNWIRKQYQEQLDHLDDA